MNTIQKTIALVALVFTVGITSVKADIINPDVNAARQNTLNTYISALTSGSVAEVANLFDSNVKFNISGSKKEFSFGKKEMLAFMKKNEGVVQQDCSTSFEWVDSQSNVAVAKVTQKYPSFSRVNYVTLVESADGWKITHVQSMFN